jgi:hypothetical protein
VLATTPRDATMDRLLSHGFIKMDRWRSLDAQQYPLRVVWPDASDTESSTNQRRVFKHALDSIYREGGWTVGLDELWYLVNELKLGHVIKVYLSQARSLDISLLSGTQRPADIPVMFYDQSTHLMFWRDNDETNLKRIGGISWRSANLVRHLVSNLERFQVLYINTRTGEMMRTRCPDLEPLGR